MRPKIDEVKRATVSSRMRPDLWERVKHQGITEKKPTFVILEKAIEAYLDEQNKEQVWQELVAKAEERNKPLDVLLRQILETIDNF